MKRISMKPFSQGLPRRDISRLRSDSRDPVLHGLGDELRSVVRAKALGNAAQDEQVREHIDDVDGFEFPINPDRQAFVRKIAELCERQRAGSSMTSGSRGSGGARGLKVPAKQPKRSRLWLADGSCLRLRYRDFGKRRSKTLDQGTTAKCGKMWRLTHF
jgi:hypothetical protein